MGAMRSAPVRAAVLRERVKTWMCVMFGLPANPSFVRCCLATPDFAEGEELILAAEATGRITTI
jgi:hypothetical protein